MSEATSLALEAGVAELVDFRLEDVGDTDLDQATAIVSFLVPRQLKLLQPKLIKFLARGGKLACYHYRWRGAVPGPAVSGRHVQCYLCSVTYTGLPTNRGAYSPLKFNFFR